MRTKDAKKVSPKVKDAIIGVKAMHPEYSALQILRDLKNNRITYRLRGERLPSKGEVYKILRENKNEIKDRQEKISSVSIDLDKDWTMGCMADLDLKNYVSPESIAHIFQVLDYAEHHSRPPFQEPYPRLTVRQALWISRLYPIISEQNRINKREKDPSLLSKKLWDWSEAYATQESISKAFNPPFDTAELDKSLREGSTPVVTRLEGAETPSVLIFHPDDRVSMALVKRR